MNLNVAFLGFLLCILITFTHFSVCFLSFSDKFPNRVYILLYLSVMFEFLSCLLLTLFVMFYTFLSFKFIR